MEREQHQATGRRWPAEWEPQAATWISWPHNLATWPDRFDAIPACFEAFIRAVCEFQPVHVLAAKHLSDARQRLAGLPDVTLHDVRTNDCWIRDYGPTFVVQQPLDESDSTTTELVGVDWQYNAWGGKYPPFDQDARVAENVCRTIDCTRAVSSLFCEGGALETDGQGTVLTTSSCLLNPNRNPGWTQMQIESELTRQLGCRVVVWVDGGGLLGDDTDGHIDQLARFVEPGVVVAAVSSLDEDENSVGLEANVTLLENATDAAGRKLTVHRLPTPPPRFIDGTRVPESYCNYLLINGAVILPTFRHAASDDYAIEMLQSFYPSRTIVPLDAYDLIWGLGAFHCASQHQPRHGA